MFWVMTQSSRPSRFQLGDRLMGGVGTGVLEEIAGEEEAPLLPAGLRTREELIDGKILRIELRPEAARTAEIGDAGFRADPRAREDDDVSGRPDHLRDVADLLIRFISDHPASLLHQPAGLGRGRQHYSRTKPKKQNEKPLPHHQGMNGSCGMVFCLMKFDIFLTHHGPFAYIDEKRSYFKFFSNPRRPAGPRSTGGKMRS